MHIRYRTINTRFPHQSPAAWHQRCAEIQGNGIHEDVCVLVRGEYLALPLGSVSTAVFERRDILEQLDVVWLFRLLSHMRYLQDLTIGFDDVAPHRGPPIQLPQFPFRLSRLVLNTVFPEARHLILASSETLEYLALGPPCDMRRSTAEVVGDLSGLRRNLRALRIDTASDKLGLPALRRLTDLAIRGEPILPCVASPQLTRLTVICTHFDDDKAQMLVSALPSFISLRTLEIEADIGNDFTLARGPGKQALADACHAGQIGVSVMRTRKPGEW